MTAQPIEVDTSLPSTGIAGVDAPVMGALDTMPTLDFSASGGGSPGDALPSGSTGALTGARGDVVKYAQRFLGTPYVWGGTQPGGFDCSGFVQYVAKHFGLNLPRVSYQQATSGKKIALNQLKPGDLVAWDENSRNSGADHIAIYIGNGQYIEAPHTGANVRISKLDMNDPRAWGVALSYPGE